MEKLEDLNKRLVNHINIVVDGSSSMEHLEATVIKVVDDLIAHLAKTSGEFKQETRITVYVFADDVKCLVFDIDVLRLPSIAGSYRTHGWTALIDAAIVSQEDLAMTPQKYGNHAFLTYIITDGEENRSRRQASQLMTLLRGQPDNWTVAVFVPDQKGYNMALRHGFPEGNIKIWESTTRKGVEEVAEVIRQTTNTYMTARASGTRGTKNLFSMNTAALTPQALKSLDIEPLKRGKFKLIPVIVQGDKDQKIVLREFITGECGLPFITGRNYYQLTKPEKIQADKEIALVRKQKAGTKEFDVYVGYEVRDFLGLPQHEVKVGPETHPDYDIFVQSNSNNRHLVYGTRLLILT